MVLTMADASLSQHVDTGLGAISNCRADVYGPKVGYSVPHCSSICHAISHKEHTSHGKSILYYLYAHACYSAVC